ncbi:ATP synthase F1 subunit epsilon [Laspinema olomoucense]|uniref:ATP synthase epsilon chain n=1 Tax=Laspinema olomoucense D3b TaxID=2953688 RepID=A0ABT2N813_9CYAN|nr:MULTISPECIES: ATP synthase F1 subunit epsilon [unclassified Laspinema]MCT7972917.1 ATP synthase F1 subunit epsilon [Laspinema sp. D3d]MCT7978838.1 ATP synthase F1 subunit epsilon [Laspinema sp. D3b]MCT7988390.1 ATP synthase F1 subunit epsilon [Laspinema sp. D3a]MCT7996432.1 ATP synthase F1 subunit epsilon [Laspinema sp. D3c]
MILNVYVITPSKTVWNAPSPEVILPTSTGQVGILPGHVAMVTFIKVGVMRIRYQKTWIPVFVQAGFAEIEGDIVTVLVNDAERGDRIGLESAHSELEKAEEQLNQAQNSLEKIRAQLFLKQARARDAAARDFPYSLQLDIPDPIALKKAPVSALTMIEHL